MRTVRLATHEDPRPPDAPHCPHDHAVAFYEVDSFLVAAVADFAAAGLRAGEAVIVIATPDHRAEFQARLDAGGIDVAAAAGRDQYIALDAETVLSSFMGPDGPQAAEFRAAITPVMDRASAGGRPIRAFGEMVAILYAAGDVTSAMALEDHWNDLATARAFNLLCAYPLSVFDDPSAADSFARICAQHSDVVPAESYPGTGVHEHQRQLAVAALQQQNVALWADVERLRAKQRELAELAYLDDLTGLGNRRAFARDLEREHALARRDGVDSYVVVADLDGFKRLNDRYGHAAGDAVLRGFAAVLRAAARETDVVARTGGDEFAVLLVRCDEEAIGAFGRRVRERMQDGLLADVSVSLGHASLTASASASAALEQADLAMFTVKRHHYR